MVVAEKGLKRLREGTKGSKSLAAKAPPVGRFGAKAINEHGLKWFNAQKEAKYAPEKWIDEGRLSLEFLTIYDTIHELGLGYMFVEPEECNLTLLVMVITVNTNDALLLVM
ncbi:hypothetical protein HAX54_038846 [Datura stramonium]|uniref:Uncharacterized protein n=1 Tax=Datura stramonium TaxID=4076 RepID=A0ABS8VNK5_DATST|nr:hypothetical protein [Datura stramonium]